MNYKNQTNAKGTAKRGALLCLAAMITKMVCKFSPIDDMLEGVGFSGTEATVAITGAVFAGLNWIKGWGKHKIGLRIFDW